MIGTTGATVLFLINVFFASVLGIGAGGLTCLVLRRPLEIKVALIDATLAASVAVVAAYLVAVMETARGVWESRVTLILIIAVATVVVMHLIRLALRSSN